MTVITDDMRRKIEGAKQQQTDDRKLLIGLAERVGKLEESGGCGEGYDDRCIRNAEEIVRLEGLLRETLDMLVVDDR